MPPVREASTKPIAATVLPAPVACSNQKRRAASGSSGCSGSCSVLVVGLLLGRVPVDGLLVLVDLLVALELLLAGGQLLDGDLAVAVRRCRCLPFWSRRAARSGCPERASTWWALSVVPSARCGSSSASSRSRPSISEYSRRHSTDGSRGRRRSRPARRRARGGGRCPRRAPRRGVLALVHEGLARELLGARRRSSSGTDAGRTTEVLSAMRLWVLGERRNGRCRAGDRPLPAATRPVKVAVLDASGGGSGFAPGSRARPE